MFSSSEAKKMETDRSNLVWPRLLVICFLTLVVAEKDPACLTDCANNRLNCDRSCGAYLLQIATYCRTVICQTAESDCRNKCPTIAATVAGTPLAGYVEIGRGTCGTQLYAGYIVTCLISGTSPDTTLQISVIRQLSSVPCISGETYGLSSDNSYLWVAMGCAAEFSVSVLVATTSLAPSTTSTRSTLSPITSTTLSPSTTTVPSTILSSTTLSPSTTTVPSTILSSTTTARPSTTPATTTRATTPVTTSSLTTAAPASRTPTRTSSLTTAAQTSTTPATTYSSTTASVAKTLWNNSNNCGQEGASGFRIIGGTEAGHCQFPYMVMVYNQRSSSLCGGTIISNSHILTAAHCLFSKDARTGVTRAALSSEILVYSGSSSMPFSGTTVQGLVRRLVSGIIVHESYDTRTLDNDIALLKLSQKIIFDQCHNSVCLTDGSVSPQQASNCRTMGWGVTSNIATAEAQSELLYVDLPIASDAACGSVYGNSNSPRTFCAGSPDKDACQGDSGGPLVCRGSDGRSYQYGVVSAGIAQQCGQSLGLYTRLSAFLPWLSSKTQ